jgi:hypothetical protein
MTGFAVLTALMVLNGRPVNFELRRIACAPSQSVSR